MTDRDAPWETSFLEGDHQTSALKMDLPNDPVIDEMMHKNHITQWINEIGKHQISAITSLPGEQIQQQNTYQIHGILV